MRAAKTTTLAGTRGAPLAPSRHSLAKQSEVTVQLMMSRAATGWLNTSSRSPRSHKAITGREGGRQRNRGLRLLASSAAAPLQAECRADSRQKSGDFYFSPRRRCHLHGCGVLHVEFGGYNAKMQRREEEEKKTPENQPNPFLHRAVRSRANVLRNHSQSCFL